MASSTCPCDGEGMDLATWELIVICAGLAAAAVNAGAFFAFSNFVMPALAVLRPSDGAEAMQAINRKAPNPIFVAAILGAGPLGAAVAIGQPVLDAAAGRYLLAGALLSGASFLITMLGNVPMNNHLDRVDALSPEGVQYWATYLVGWTRWNTLRTLASLASAVTYGLALR